METKDIKPFSGTVDISTKYEGERKSDGSKFTSYEAMLRLGWEDVKPIKVTLYSGKTKEGKDKFSISHNEKDANGEWTKKTIGHLTVTPEVDKNGNPWYKGTVKFNGKDVWVSLFLKKEDGSDVAEPSFFSVQNPEEKSE